MGNKINSYLGKGISFEGVIHADHRLTVEGRVEGEIKATDEVILKRGALVEGPIQAKKITYEQGARHSGMMKIWGNDLLPRPGSSWPSVLTKIVSAFRKTATQGEAPAPDSKTKEAIAPKKEKTIEKEVPPRKEASEKESLSGYIRAEKQPAPPEMTTEKKRAGKESSAPKEDAENKRAAKEEQNPSAGPASRQLW